MKSDFTLVPPGTTLEQAVGMLNGAGEVGGAHGRDCASDSRRGML